VARHQSSKVPPESPRCQLIHQGAVAGPDWGMIGVSCGSVNRTLEPGGGEAHETTQRQNLSFGCLT